MKSIEISLVAMVALSILFIGGCGGFGSAPLLDHDAGMMMPEDDAGNRPPPREIDSGVREMPRESDAGTDVDRPISGEDCDPDRDAHSFENGDYACTLERCTAAYLACLRGVWHCVPDVGAVCLPEPSTEDAGTPMVGTDAGSPVSGIDAGAPSVGTDAGPPAPRVDAGPLDYCVPDSFVGCWFDCGYPGHIDCNPATGRYDANGGACQPFEGLECPAPRTDAGSPAPVDAGTDSGPPPTPDAGSDAGMDAGTDAGSDAGTDAGTPDAGSTGPTRTITVMFHVEDAYLQSTSSLDLLEEVADAGATRADARPATCDAGTAGLVTEGGRTYFRCTMTRPLGAELFFVGRFRARASSVDGWSEGQQLATMSGWGRRDCGSAAATPHVLWVIRDAAGLSLLNPDGLPSIVQPRAITEDGFPVCRGRVVF